MQAWGGGSSKARMGLNKRAASGEGLMDAGEGEGLISPSSSGGLQSRVPSPRGGLGGNAGGGVEQRAGSLSRQGVPPHGSAFPSETQLQQVRTCAACMRAGAKLLLRGGSHSSRLACQIAVQGLPVKRHDGGMMSPWRLLRLACMQFTACS